jgi:hypothetical protein
VAVPGVAKAHITGSPTDIDMLNFALTLEHLEYAFYRDGLQKFSAQDIKNSGSSRVTRRGSFAALPTGTCS